MSRVSGMILELLDGRTHKRNAIYRCVYAMHWLGD